MLYKNKFRIESTRLPNYDYSTGGWYFITINTLSHKNFFGEISNNKMVLNDVGKIVETEWINTEKTRMNVSLDYYVIMPNHLHGIVIIEGEKDKSAQQDKRYKTKSQNLSNIIRGFKASSTSKIHSIGHTDFYWQSRFFDRIIRTETELFLIRNYIEQNPLRWQLDKDVPENIF